MRDPCAMTILRGKRRGSSRLATLGWRTQSLRDWGGNGGLVGNDKPRGRGRIIGSALPKLARKVCWRDGVRSSLSPGERAGVRGNATSDRQRLPTFPNIQPAL